MSFEQKYLNCLDELEKEVLGKLKRACLDKKSSFRYLVLSTCAKKIVNSRIVVLRSFYSKDWKIIIHSDNRSEKLKDILDNNNVALNFWDSRNKFQVRIKGKAEICKKNIKSDWNSLSIYSKKNYFLKKKPGSKSNKASSGLDESFVDNKHFVKENGEGFKNFCIIKIFIKSFDCLILNKKGFRRALLTVSKNKLKKQWLIP